MSGGGSSGGGASGGGASEERRRLAAKARLRRSGLLPQVATLAREPVAGCDACGEPRPWRAATEDRYGLPVTVHVCPRCLLVSQTDRLTRAAAADFYRALYRPLVSAFHGTRIDAAAVAAESRARAGEAMTVLAPHRQEIQGGRWVDVGGGTGGSILGLIDGGLEPGEALVVDPSADELAVARGAGFGTVEATAEDPTAWATGDYDLVLCLQTLDHLLSWERAWTSFHAALRPGGLLVLTVGDHALARRDGRMDLQLDHTFALTAATLERVAPRWGFALERLGFSRSGSLAALLRCVERPEVSPPDPPPIDRVAAARLLARVLSPVCPRRPLTWRGRAYRLKRRLSRLLSRRLS